MICVAVACRAVVGVPRATGVLRADGVFPFSEVVALVAAAVGGWMELAGVVAAPPQPASAVAMAATAVPSIRFIALLPVIEDSKGPDRRTRGATIHFGQVAALANIPVRPLLRCGIVTG